MPVRKNDGRRLGQLPNLIKLTLAGNDLSGCLPAAPSDLPYNDFEESGLPFCAS